MQILRHKMKKHGVRFAKLNTKARNINFVYDFVLFYFVLLFHFYWVFISSGNGIKCLSLINAV